ncbi:MAG: hypothetical protein NVS1B4_18960 [Gemmatimonadaceae bacterium]
MTASSTVRIFVNGVGADVPAGTTALEAVRAVDLDAAAAVASGTKLITDSRGLPLSADALSHGGAIYRTIAARPLPRTD